jgi:uncharacterized lipoprotein YddW (UPF0748 family)
MSKSFLTYLIVYTFFLLYTSFAQSAPKRELRGAWIATVANIDYPLDRHASTEEKVAELRSLINRLHDLGINTVFFQIRTECDALYNSSIEPWSYWLTGKQGTAPEPYFDPLETAIAEAHKLGMQLHAWINPYRCIKNLSNYEFAGNHVSKKHPDWILSIKDYKMLDPGNPNVTPYIVSVVSDVLDKYDVDGIHFDDYFYPYEPKIHHEDEETFRKNPRGFTNIESWRRDNINTMIAQVDTLIKSKKPNVLFGVSPFGIVENKYTSTSGMESYSTLYCDPLNWVSSHTVDYLAPQLYWEIGHPRADFAKLLPWWAGIGKNCRVYAGLYSSNFLAKKHAGADDEMYQQLQRIRTTPDISGMIFFSAKSLINNKDFADSLTGKYFLYPSLPPAFAIKDTGSPNTPLNGVCTVTDSQITLTWDAPVTSFEGEKVTRYAIYRFGRYDRIDMDDATALRAVISSDEAKYSEVLFRSADSFVYVISAIDKMNNESAEHLIIRPEVVERLAR